MWQCPQCNRTFVNTEQHHFCGKIETIDQYISEQNENIRPLLRQIYDTIRKAAPEAAEKISWRMPTFWQGENLIHFAAFKRHIGIYPGDLSLAPFEKRLSGYHKTKGTIQFPLDKPIDFDLIKDITEWRLSCVEDKQSASWKQGDDSTANANHENVFRCFGDTPIYIEYHDNEWGRPVHDDRKLFEMLILEGAQAGLSWITVLKKREAYREAFDGFDPAKVALYDDVKIAGLMANPGIIRNRLKINAAIVNAKLFLDIQEKHGSFDKFIWRYVDYTPIVGNWERFEDMPITTPISDRISKDLKQMGFKFVGSTIIYSFMQAVGMVNDHLKSCCVSMGMVCGHA